MVGGLVKMMLSEVVIIRDVPTLPFSGFFRRCLTFRGFLDWMYPAGGGGENVESAALGVLILWTTWFAFNAGSTESITGVCCVCVCEWCVLCVCESGVCVCVCEWCVLCV